MSEMSKRVKITLNEPREAKLRRYIHAPGDQRQAYTAGEEGRWLAVVLPGGSGFDTVYLAPGETWPEGSGEFLAAFKEKAQADEYIDDYMGG